MELNFTRHIKPLQDAGLVDPAKIAAVLSAFTVKPIGVRAVVEYFRRSGLWFVDVLGGGGFGGKLQAAATKSGQSDPIKMGLQQFAALIFGPDSTQEVGTTSPIYAVQIHQILGELVAGGDITSGEADGFFLLGGGLLFAGGVKAADVTSEIQAHEDASLLAAQKQSLEDAAKNRMQAFRESLTAWDGSGDPPVL